MGHKRFQGNNLATVLEIQKQIDKVVIQFWCEDLVVDQNNICTLQSLTNVDIRHEVTPLKLHCSRSEPPQTTARLEFDSLRFCKRTSIFHDLTAPALASNLQSRLQYHACNS